MTVAQMRRSISAAEYRQWAVFYARRQQQRELAARKG